jgi:hypothetical protein
VLAPARTKVNRSPSLRRPWSDNLHVHKTIDVLFCHLRVWRLQLE